MAATPMFEVVCAVRIPFNKSVQKCSVNLWSLIYRDIDLSKVIFER